MTVTLAFYKAPGDKIDKLTRWATGSQYSHVEMKTPSGDWVTASKRDGKQVRVKSMRLKPGHWDVFYLRMDLQPCWERIVPELGKPYDTVGAVLSVTPFKFSRPNLWFCSEILAYAIGLPQPHTFTPELLNRSVKNHSLCMSHIRSAL